MAAQREPVGALGRVLRLGGAPVENGAERGADLLLPAPGNEDPPDAQCGMVGLLGVHSRRPGVERERFETRSADETGECVLDELSQITSWDGGGLHAETDPGGNMPPECFMLLTLNGEIWEQAYPEEVGEMECIPDGTVELSGRVVDQAELDENRISTVFQP